MAGVRSSPGSRSPEAVAGAPSEANVLVNARVARERPPPSGAPGAGGAHHHARSLARRALEGVERRRQRNLKAARADPGACTSAVAAPAEKENADPAANGAMMSTDADAALLEEEAAKVVELLRAEADVDLAPSTPAAGGEGLDLDVDAEQWLVASPRADQAEPPAVLDAAMISPSRAPVVEGPPQPPPPPPPPLPDNRRVFVAAVLGGVTSLLLAAAFLPRTREAATVSHADKRGR